MTPYKDQHVSEDQLLWTIVDEAEVTPDMREHIARCFRCRNRKAQVEQDLIRLGRAADRFAPITCNQPALPPERTRRTIRPRGLQLSFGAAAMVAAITLMVWWFTPKISTEEDPLGFITQVTWVDDHFMTEINRLLENKFPQVYLETLYEPLSSMDDDFIEFVTPIT